MSLNKNKIDNVYQQTTQSNAEKNIKELDLSLLCQTVLLTNSHAIILCADFSAVHA